VISLELYQQIYAYDTGNNLTNLSHQAKSNAWQQTISIHTSNNHGTENNKQNNFDANGNLLHFAEDVGADVQDNALLFCLVD
jgi:insecticidal toxin complex protein TccC